MKSLIWKELRENLKWAVLLLLVFGGVGAMTGISCGITEQFLSFVTFVAAVSGAAWGLWQTTFETQGDRRAHLLHRPLSPSWIFVGKLLTGAGLNLVAMSLPLAVYGVWTAMPGHMPAPFRWQALLPWLADILTGLVYYSAGTLMGVRSGRWYGSRCLGIPAALLCTFLVWNVPEFWHALVAIVTIGGLIAVAAWGSFLSGGSLDQQPRAAKAALACTYLMGLIVVSVEAKVIAESLIVPADAHRRSQYYAWDREGRLMVVHQLGKDGYRLTDIAGRELEEFQRNPISSSAELALLYPPSTYWGPSFSPTYRTRGWRCVPFLGSSLVREENWYYLPDDGRLVGYDRANNRFLGSFGPDSFSPPGELPASRFTGELSIEIRFRSVAPLRLLAFPHEVYAVDLRGRSMKRLFVAASGEIVLWAQPLPEERQTPMQVVVGTDRSIHVVDDGGRELFAAPRAYDPQGYGGIAVRRFENPPRWGLNYQPSSHLGMIRRQMLPDHLLQYDGAGREIARTSLPGIRFLRPAKFQPAFGLVTSPAEAAILLGAVGDTFFGARSGEEDRLSPFSNNLFNIVACVIPDPLELAPEMDRGRFLLYGVCLLTTAVICTLFCFLWSRRYAFSRWSCLGWSLCGFLFGPTGLLLMLSVHDWPARVSCPKCGLRRIVTRDTCEHCGAPHASAPPDGTEIWESELQEVRHSTYAGV